MTDTLMAELTKLEGLAGNAPGKWPPLLESLDSLLFTLRSSKDALQSSRSDSLQEIAFDLSRAVDSKKKALDERQKETYNSSTRLGKGLDKRFPNPLPNLEPFPFGSEPSVSALETVISTHLLRTGQFEPAATFITEVGKDVPSELQTSLLELHELTSCLDEHNATPAIQWAQRNRPSLDRRNSPLEFMLHKLKFLSFIVQDEPWCKIDALKYLRSLDPSIYGTNSQEIHRLITSLIFLPYDRLLKSPYADVVDPTLHGKTRTELSREFCASVGLSRMEPLRIAGDIGAGGALLRIEKGRKVMRERKSDWSQADELPIEIPLTAEHRFHSIFACMVSKEQSTDANPPMMIPCGHVLAKDSIASMAKSNGRVKCPYCPAETTTDSPFNIYF